MGKQNPIKQSVLIKSRATPILELGKGERKWAQKLLGISGERMGACQQ
jgi:hypothetical protein